MAWAPSSTFEDEFIDLQSDFNFVYGQHAYELKRQQESAAVSDPRPKSTYEYLAQRERRNEELERLHGTAGSKSREIRSSLAMMERIQQISGTKPLGEHATMADWDDTTTIEQEAIAMMRHFGMASLADEAILCPPKEDIIPSGKIHVMRNGRRTFPLILDPNYFVPRKTRPSSKGNIPPNAFDSTSYSSCDTSGTACSECSSVYFSTKSHLDTSKSSQEEDEIPISYQLLVDSTHSTSETELKESQTGKPKVTKYRKERAARERSNNNK